MALAGIAASRTRISQITIYMMLDRFEALFAERVWRKTRDRDHDWVDME